jgi:hypothetical protein
MDDPIKLIWKFKNNNRRTQYHIYVYVGPTVAKDVMKILDKISELSLYDTLITLSSADIKKLEDTYGTEWYKKFFNTYHINNTISLAKETSAQKKELEEKLGSKWFKEHIESHELVEKKLLYNYQSLIKDERSRKNMRKGRTVAIVEDETDLDYTTHVKDDITKLFNVTKSKLKGQSRQKIDKNVQLGGDLPDSDDDDVDIRQVMNEYGKADTIISPEELENTINYSNQNLLVGNSSDICIDCNKTYDTHERVNPIQSGGDEAEQGNDNDEEFEQGLDNSELLSDEEIDYDEIEEMYKDVDVAPDDNLVNTTSLIKKALNDDNLFEKQKSALIEFDTSKDTNMYDENLKDVYKKFYITQQYIFMDDTVKAVKEKICCSLRNNNKFDKESLLAPSRQYLWSEYYYGTNIEKIMVGQKWVRRNELLNIDVEPNTNLRVYEELRGNLKTLRDNIRRYGNKIRYENDENNILFDYDDYITNNEIFMIDIYNEFGKGYSPDSEAIKNIIDVYLKVYFNKIKGEDLKLIIEYLTTDQKPESNKISVIYETINNDLVMENEIMNVVENVKVIPNYKTIFRDNYITQSVIHVNLRLVEGTKIDLYRIFKEFEPNNQYPFIQYQTPDGQIVFSFSEGSINEYQKKKDNMEVLSKWFENAPYGISFKVKINEKDNDKFMAINLNESGRIEYKTQWKEDDMATINDIKKTYAYVKNLIKKINEERNRVKIDIPDDSEFKYAFINTIQKFELPENFVVNHNDLSEFSRYFYPYVALVIEPRKRQAKVQKGDDKSKFGTYLRYKRVTKYENQARLEQRIMYFMRNYEYSDQTLSNEISKQFNITEERAMEEIEKVRSRYPNIKRSRKILKKLENIPKYKPPGIGIDIQGKQRDKYKIRISGARDKKQLDRIISFMNILIYLYIDTYLYKNPERQILKEKLKKLTNIAKRRSKVDEIVNYSKEVKTVKQMTHADKRRIGFKPEKGQNQWTRSCQNSGNDKKRRPQHYFENKNMGEMVKKGYVLNKKTGEYERKVSIKGRGGKKTEILLRTIRLQEFDETGASTGNDVHYACSPDENGEHMYVGFLTRSSNPFGHCMPCCFKKDPLISKNKEKREFHLRCLGQAQGDKTQENQKVIGDRLYILQDTNKIQEGRFGFLPKYLDFFFNNMLNKQRKIKHHYLVKTETGYFFKYGSKQEEYQFLNSIGSLLDLSLNDIRAKLITALENDKSDLIFTAINNGDIKTQFLTRENYIEFIKYNGYLDFEILNNIISIPGVLTKHGLNILIFQKRTIIIKKTLEKEKTKEDFYLTCQNNEDMHAIFDKNRETIFMLKENKNYYPVVMVLKDNENTKNMSIKKLFNYENDPMNIVHHVSDFYIRNCFGNFLDEIVNSKTALTAKETYYNLVKLNDKNYAPKYQVIDTRNKCKYLITNNNTIISVRPSGSLYNLQIVKAIDKYISEFDDLYKNLNEVYTKSNKKITTKPIGVYYDEKKGSSVKAIAIMTETQDIIPIKTTDIESKKLEQLNLIAENKPLYDKIDKEILKGKENYVLDKRINEINYDKYYNESYELFRLEFSDYINRQENITLKARLEQIISDNKLEKRQKVDKIRLMLYRLIDRDLYDRYKKGLYLDKDLMDEIIVNDHEGEDEVQDGGAKYDKLLHVTTKVPDLSHYQVNNDRGSCKIHENKDQCATSTHCKWVYNGCYMSITKGMAVTFVTKISEELSSNDLKAFEIMRVGNYFVSDIVDYNKFTERQGQKIVRSSSNAIKKVLFDLFGKDNIPKIGKRRGIKSADINYQQVNLEHPLRDMKDLYVQDVIENNLSIFRTYVNGYYWIKHSFYDSNTRNLGYYGLLQTDLANYFKSMVIDWLQDSKNKKTVLADIPDFIESKRSSKDIIHDFIVKLADDVFTLTNCIVELYILNKVQNIPIVVYNDDNALIYIFDNGLVYHHLRSNNISKKEIEKYTAVGKRIKNINMRFSFITNGSIPDELEILYYKE